MNVKKISAVWLLVVIAFFLLSGCSTSSTTSSVIEPKKIVLAWGDKPEWTDHLIAEIDKANWSNGIEVPCKTANFRECLAQLMSEMVRWESSFNPKTEYKENFKDSKGNWVISRGLFQLSIESANQKAYGCGFKTEQEIHEPLKNISCAVKIVNHWLNKDLVFFGGEKLGVGRYWSVGRASSSKNAKIKEYLSKF